MVVSRLSSEFARLLVTLPSCRAGLAPAEDPRLFTAHAKTYGSVLGAMSRVPAHLSEEARFTASIAPGCGIWRNVDPRDRTPFHCAKYTVSSANIAPTATWTP